jgi:exonuclease VII large subunit
MEERESALNDKEDQLIQREQEMAKEQRKLSERERDLIEQENKLREQEQCLNDQQSQIQEQQHRLVELEKQLLEKEKYLMEREQYLGKESGIEPFGSLYASNAAIKVGFNKLSSSKYSNSTGVGMTESRPLTRIMSFKSVEHNFADSSTFAKGECNCLKSGKKSLEGSELVCKRHHPNALSMQTDTFTQESGHKNVRSSTFIILDKE